MHEQRSRKPTDGIPNGQRRSTHNAENRPTTESPEGEDNKAKWYKEMRAESNRELWVGTNRKARDELREGALNQDEATNKDLSTYNTTSHDVVNLPDRDSEILLCKVSTFFQLLFGDATATNVCNAIRRWSAMPSLPVPKTKRHMVDDFTRQEMPQLDLEKARSLKELEKRYQCVVHYGTWAMKGHTHPDEVWLTENTVLGRGRPRAVHENYVGLLFLRFKRYVLGLAQRRYGYS
ncbi:uncharacterized protein JN550_007990 [Neoarthrinium moseri]|uniref:uncharacterized protein n=1 Tax=Neoarthrinium moseri TaxID=1658444 RepID=UPI001FDBE7FD|nr:uncharacterized protein JN550_007990 [Neoarthrinium moseri]KAI1866012.1 hypothetical protein JN550_007990 [Neoarthrinium moseri]